MVSRHDLMYHEEEDDSLGGIPMSVRTNRWLGAFIMGMAGAVIGVAVTGAAFL